MEKYRVAFFGTPQIAKGILETLLTMEQVEVVLVVSQPDKVVGRKQEVVFNPVKQFCLEQKLTCLQPNKVSEIVTQLAQANLDFIITCAYGQFISSKILQLPKIAALNIHGSLLPKYRGGAPIQYAIWNGDQQTGVSLMKMEKQMDAGPVYSTRTIAIDQRETSGSLFKKIEKLGQQIIQEDLMKVVDQSLKPVVQDESKVTFAYNISSDQERIDWTQSNQQIDQMLRALYPTPIGHTFIGDTRYKIGLAVVVDETQKHVQPGTILDFEKDGILVQTGSGVLKVLELQLPGKKMQPASNYFASLGTKELKIGAQFH